MARVKYCSRAVDAPRGEQFLGADDSQFVALLGADQVLAALAASERQVSGTHVPSARQIRQQRGVLVVGMRGDHHDAAEVVQLVQHQTHLGLAGDVFLGAGRGGEQGNQQHEADTSAPPRRALGEGISGIRCAFL